ncbi:MAG TPA: FHA domain-containing protein [Polyangiaceae bacterium]|nr:FHA domain-containing protein [Polyangiaceae bacterium]
MPDDRSSKDQEATIAGGAPVYNVTRRRRPMFLRQLKGPGAPRDVPLELDEVVLGRGLDAQVSIESGAVSRRHASLVRSNERYTCVDLESSNGVFVNGERVSSKELRDGDSVQVGDALFVFYEAR